MCLEALESMAMNQLGTVYATKRRRRNSKSLKPPPKDGVTKSNPSKRHRERLNAELDTLASLLPFEASILSKLDKLSILRLSVSYLRTKSYFQATYGGGKEHSRTLNDAGRHYELPCLDAILDSDLILQALNGFLLILASEGEVFFASNTIENYLGFHQSDIVHQSVYELVHSEDREELQRQLMWNSLLPQDGSTLTFHDVLQPDNVHYLERSFTVRFRCLLDNTSGFLRLDIRGRIKVLHGQNRKTEDPPLALFAVCTPFGPPSLLEVPQKEVMFKSKHKLDMSLVSMDQRGKSLLGYNDSELANKGGYDLVHFDDLAYVANAHQELLKTGASGMIAYRIVTKDCQWQWLQTSSRLVYKCSKPDFIICTHRPLMEEEGRDLLGKRTMDFKVSYLDGTLGNSSSYGGDSPTSGGSVDYNTNSTNSVNNNNGNCGSGSSKSNKGRRSKNQLRDILTTCRKRKNHSNEYLEDGCAYNSVYSYPTTDSSLTPYSLTSNLHQSLYPSPHLDNSRFLSAEDFLQYRHLSNYYADYSTVHHPAQYAAAAGNGFLDVSGASAAVAARACLPPSYAEHIHYSKEDKLYACQLDSIKYNCNNNNSHQSNGGTGMLAMTKMELNEHGYPDPSGIRSCIVTTVPQSPLLTPLERTCKMQGISPSSLINHSGTGNEAELLSVQLVDKMIVKSSLKEELNDDQRYHNHQHHNINSHHHHIGTNPGSPIVIRSNNGHDLLKQQQQQQSYTNDTRQTVLMWGSASGSRCRTTPTSSSSSSSSSSSPCVTTLSYGNVVMDNNNKSNRGYTDNGAVDVHMACKWVSGNNVGSGSDSSSTPKSTSPNSSSPHMLSSNISSRVLTPITAYGASPYSNLPPDVNVNINPVSAVTAGQELHQQHGRDGGDVSGIDNKQDCHSPLLSISEVTNALLSHE
ncbi:hypothetical protein CHUAL_011416 [Chamberlinius hualienensis]